MSTAKKIGLTAGAIVILGIGGYALAKYDTGSYAHVLYEKTLKKSSKDDTQVHRITDKSVKPTVKVDNKAESPKSNSSGIEKALQEQNFTGAYAVIKNGQVSDSKTIGKGIENGKLYQVADLENTLTAAAIMKLVDSGKLSLSTPVSKFYNESLEVNKNVTVKSLLNMTSGITNNDVPNDQLQAGDNILQWNLNHANAGTASTYNYQEINYVLLEGIISQVSGTSYQSYINNNFLKPNNLNNIKFVSKVSDPELATPFNGNQKMTGGALAKAMNSQMGMNQIMASPSDYLKLMQILVKSYGDKQGFTAVNAQDMTGQLESSADGFEGSAGIQGYKTAVKISKDGNSGIILMSNNSNGQTSDSNGLLETVRKVFITERNYN
ncbi:serine hydrolase domain-containing protein [Ligilactobacillus aviarius]|uniref:serine hydrolase domain-containing protein n=1 Tax=Ligilactobacillus aviarius TaxID=1606 RepID=UPI0007D9BDD7|nr:serine hydrolase domain-containing protein [Ligilactobacillus aviarius]OAQ03907.1 hypothetical protein A3O10_05350 [Ligilactobacillus aviarius]OAQ04024.1 hypothetical protein A3O11_06115 [Ligilactobacillus aviarius]OAS77729.1 hypothetical protein A3O18_01445 [Ligilactobacillus aviarius]PEG71000.1 hypothetical protein A3P04_03425 [Ligilactobacillus aviarius]PEG73694.1 hypothetical protein A3O82_04900 [Ligilactobacillus aviarius]